MEEIKPAVFAAFMEYITTSDAPENHAVAGPVILDWFVANPTYIGIYCGLLLEAVLRTGNPESGVVSLWATAFQMGREFERLQIDQGILDRIVTS
jgi:hypothetical protein